MNIKSIGDRVLIVGWLALAACSSGLPDKKETAQGGDSSVDDENKAGSGGRNSQASGGTQAKAGSGAGKGGVNSGSSGSSGSAKLEWAAEELVDPYEAAELPGLALDADGNAWAVWNHRGNATSDAGEIQARRYDAAKGVWEDMLVLDDTARTTYHVVVEGSPRGDVIAVWTKAGKDVPDVLTIRAALYSAESTSWSDAADLGTIKRGQLAGIRAKISSAGTAVVAWPSVFVDNAVDDTGTILMSSIHAEVTTRWFDGDWQEPSVALDLLSPQVGVLSESSSVLSSLPIERFDLAFEDDTHVRALAGWEDGVLSVSGEDGEWSEPVTVTEEPGGSVHLGRLASGDMLATFVASGSLYASTSAAGESSFTKPELMERGGDGIGYFSLATAPADTAATAAVTWTIGSQSGGSQARTVVSVRDADGAWSEAKELGTFGAGYPTVAITSAGKVIVGSGHYIPGLWTSVSLDGTTWPSSYDQFATQHNTDPAMMEVRFAVASSGAAMFLWKDNGGSEAALKNHILAVAGH